MYTVQLYETEYFKLFQTLPKFSPNILAHCLVGARPLKAIIHQKMLSLLMNIRRKNGIEVLNDKQQLAMKTNKSMSCFHRVNAVAQLYGLPNSFTVMEESPWDKLNWKKTIRNSINESIETSWLLELRKPSLISVNPGAISIGVPHPVWATARYSPHASRQAISKMRFLTDTMMNGEKMEKMFGQSAACQCGFPVEHRFHQLLDCPIYNDLRNDQNNQFKIL